MDANSVHIELSETEGARVFGKYNGIGFSKNLSIKTLQEVFNLNGAVETGLLPVGCKFYSRTDSATNVFIETEPGFKQCVFYDYDEDEEIECVIPVPRLFWHFSFLNYDNEYQFKNASVWVLKEPITHANLDNIVLYRFPFSNVYDDGKICFGGLPSSIESQLGPSTAWLLIDLFWSREFSSDLDQDNFDAFRGDDGEKVYDARGLFEYLDGRKKFPYDILYEYRSLDTILESI